MRSLDRSLGGRYSIFSARLQDATDDGRGAHKFQGQATFAEGKSENQIAGCDSGWQGKSGLVLEVRFVVSEVDGGG